MTTTSFYPRRQEGEAGGTMLARSQLLRLLQSSPGSSLHDWLSVGELLP